MIQGYTPVKTYKPRGQDTVKQTKDQLIYAGTVRTQLNEQIRVMLCDGPRGLFGSSRMPPLKQQGDTLLYVHCAIAKSALLYQLLVRLCFWYCFGHNPNNLNRSYHRNND